MKKITQQDIRKVLGCEIATVSRYLTGARDIKLKTALEIKNELNVPVEIFTDSELQIKYFGKSFITDNSISNHTLKSSSQNKQEVTI